MKKQRTRIAIVADWLIDFGGAELVISHLLEMFPEADIYTSVCYMDHPMLEGRRVYTSWLQKVPFFNKHHKLAGLLRPWAFRSFDLSGYDLVICSSSAESKQVVMGKWRYYPPPEKGELEGVTQKGIHNNVTHPNLPFSGKEGNKKPITIVYCHTPTRYYWSHAKEYEDMMEFGILNPLVKGVFRLVKGWMQRVDYAAAQRVDYFIANSENTKERIMKYYGRESEVIYPGVELPRHREERIDPEQQKGNPNSDWIASHPKSTSIASQKGAARNDRNGETPYYLGLGRCIPYKRFDLLVDAFNANGKKLILATATDTPLFRELKARSRPNIEWKYRVSNEEKDTLMAGAKAFLFPPEEDFGLVPVEAMMHGTPVIAYGNGGATESVVEGETGVFFSPQTPETLNEAIEKFEKMKWDRDKIHEHAKKFSKEKFQESLLKFIKAIAK